MRKCPKCGRVLPDNMFAPHTLKCRLCRRDYDWGYKYGLSPERYLKMYNRQEGKCKICGKKLPDGEYLHVDHVKGTQKIRGLLCAECNKGLGFFKDSPDNLREAAKYLEENG